MQGQFWYSFAFSYIELVFCVKLFSFLPKYEWNSSMSSLNITSIHTKNLLVSGLIS